MRHPCSRSATRWFAHLVAVLPNVARNVPQRVDPVEHRVHMIEATDAVVLQRRDAFEAAETKMLDLRIERRARLLVRLAAHPRRRTR